MLWQFFLGEMQLYAWTQSHGVFLKALWTNTEERQQRQGQVWGLTGFYITLETRWTNHPVRGCVALRASPSNTHVNMFFFFSTASQLRRQKSVDYYKLLFTLWLLNFLYTLTNIWFSFQISVKSQNKVADLREIQLSPLFAGCLSRKLLLLHWTRAEPTPGCACGR